MKASHQAAAKRRRPSLLVVAGVQNLELHQAIRKQCDQLRGCCDELLQYLGSGDRLALRRAVDRLGRGVGLVDQVLQRHAQQLGRLGRRSPRKGKGNER